MIINLISFDPGMRHTMVFPLDVRRQRKMYVLSSYCLFRSRSCIMYFVCISSKSLPRMILWPRKSQTTFKGNWTAENRTLRSTLTWRSNSLPEECLVSRNVISTFNDHYPSVCSVRVLETGPEWEMRRLHHGGKGIGVLPEEAQIEESKMTFLLMYFWCIHHLR